VPAARRSSVHLRRVIGLAVTAGVLVALAACGDDAPRRAGSGPTAPSTVPTTTSTPATTTSVPEAPGRADARRALDAARSRWAAHGAADYTMILEWSCFCPPMGPWTITVRNGRVAAVEPDPGEARPHALDVDGLFGEIARAVREATGPVDVSYDADLGYPVRGGIDWVRNAIDDEMSFAVSDLTLQ
jgi:hypothetical protein